jgi:hypothetical protein
MFYTRTEIDALPLTSTMVAYEPCLNKNSRSTDPINRFYTLEIEQDSQCLAEANTNITIDNRYINLGYEISDYDLLIETDIFYLLLRQPRFRYDILDPDRIK